IYQPRVSGDALSAAPPWVKTARSAIRNWTVRRVLGEPLSPPEAAFAAANRAAGLSDGFINQSLPRVAARSARALPWANMFRPVGAAVGVLIIKDSFRARLRICQ
ncbi:MAG: hypothetical protein LBP75_09340, partial [Planctomycetota bacterium]|nr:hypothetical protein [Planctomycetota bacterium]